MNGNVVMALEDLQYVEDGEIHRLDHGQIQLLDIPADSRPPIPVILGHLS